jgi:predicted outer membrane protein
VRWGLLLFGVSLVVAATLHVIARPAAAGVAGTAAAPARLTATGGSGALPAGWTLTPYGPLTPADRDLLVRVRQAGLWEMPAGLMAQTQAASGRVKTVGAQLMADHHGLDVQVQELAGKLGVTLPDQPNKDQQGWLAEMRDKVGNGFDTVFANRLRAAHGKVFSIVSAVRAGTSNDLIREFGQTAVNVVMKHMTLLESTGLVDYAALPTAPAATPQTPANLLSEDMRPRVIWGLLSAGGCLSLIAYLVYRHRQPRHYVVHY